MIDRDGGTHGAGPVDRPVPVASITKLFTATAVLVAVEEGTLSLDTPAGPPGATVAHLLAHASGLGPEGGILAPPGKRRIYSNAGYEALAETLGRAAGMPAARYLSEAVPHALGLTRTNLEGSPAHGATASAHDVAVLARAWAAPGALLAASTVEAATRPFRPELAGVLPGFGSQTPNDWGLGPEIRGHKQPHWTGARNSPRTYGHFGRSGTFCWIDPVAGCALVGLGEEPFGPWAQTLWPEIADTVLDAVGVPA